MPTTWASDEVDAWHADVIHLSGAQSITLGSPNITIAVIDNGVNFSHPALTQAAWQNPDEIPFNELDDDNNGYIDDITGWDYINNDSLPLPTPDERDNDLDSEIDELLWHGTFIAGLISGNDPKSGFRGISPGCKIMALRILDSDAAFNGSLWTEMIEAINYAINEGADIISFSSTFLGRPPQGFFDAVKRATDAEIPFVGASGNQNDDIVSFPARIDGILSIGAISRDLKKASFSSYGAQLDLVAPGVGITSCTQNTGYKIASGTSYAVPLITSTIALMISVNSTLSREEIETMLKETAIDLGPPGKDNEFGYGLLDSENAVRRASGLPLRSRATTESGELIFLRFFGFLIVAALFQRKFRRSSRGEIDISNLVHATGKAL
ncbi:MAG: S8 family serine peptidase [Candidatus Heimdallarchaeota archaeon]